VPADLIWVCFIYKNCAWKSVVQRANILVVISALVYRTPHKAMKRQFVEKVCLNLQSLLAKELCSCITKHLQLYL
jgi:hypothetical protein